MKKIVIVFCILCVSAFTMISDESLVILHSNDTHSQIDPDFDGKGGILRRKAIVDSIRDAEKNVLLVDAGDVVQGTLYFSLFKGVVEFSMMDSLRYDIMIMGNHEFDNAIEGISPFYKRLKATKLATNYDVTNTPLNGYLDSYIIKEYDDKKIGFIGIGLDPKGMVSEGNYNGLIYNDAIEVANAKAKWLKEEADVDLVVVISHLGYKAAKDGAPSDFLIASKSTDIDIIIGGHSHTLINPNSSKSNPWLVPNAEGRNVLITQVGKQGKHLGYIKIDLETLTAESSVLPVTKQYDDRIDSSLVKLLKPYSDEVAKSMNKEIAQSAKSLTNSKLGGLSNWVADVALDLARKMTPEKVDLAIMNVGGIRQPMPKGSVSEGLIRVIFPFENRIVVLKIKGSDLLDAFGVMAVRYGDAVDKGVSVRFNRHKKITKATINNKKIDKNKYYTLATIDYLANGGDYMAPLLKATTIATTDLKLDDMIVDYVKEMTAKGEIINPSDESRMYME